MSYVEYDSNNSGGDWWLTDDDWLALEAAGWLVPRVWQHRVYDDGGKPVMDDRGLPAYSDKPRKGREPLIRRAPGERFLGAIATKAYRVGLSLRDAAAEWERITGQDATAAGCACCGQPHTFTEYDDAGRYVASGPDAEYVARW